MTFQHVVILFLFISDINLRELPTRLTKIKDYGQMRCNKELDFCNTACPISGEKVLHVACKCNGNGIDHLDCKEYRVHRNNFIRLNVIHSINTLRNQVALGTAKGPHNISITLPKASNMRLLNYNVALEYAAWCTSNKCKAERDSCIYTKNFKFVQQLVFTMEAENLISESDLLSNSIKFWMDDIKSNPPNVNNNTVTGNWSNFWPVLLWASANQIGCALKYKRGVKNKRQLFFVCNIAGDDNPENTNIVYKSGKPCTICKESEGKDTYADGLCGEFLAVPIAARPKFCNSEVLIIPIPFLCFFYTFVQIIRFQ